MKEGEVKEKSKEYMLGRERKGGLQRGTKGDTDKGEEVGSRGGRDGVCEREEGREAFGWRE